MTPSFNSVIIIEEMDIQQEVEEVKRELVEFIIKHLRENKLPAEKAKKLAEDFLKILPISDQQDLLDKLKNLGENYLEAKKFLTQLQKDFPKYNTKKIKTLIDDCKKASIVKNIAMLGEKADKAFDKKDYSAARSYYREILAYAKKWGNPYGSLCLANVQYNIALTYWNERNYKKAKEYLLELRSKYPDYEKEDVQDFINRATYLGY